MANYNIALTKPDDSQSASFPSPFTNPANKDKKYDVLCARSIYWSNWANYNNPFGNFYRNQWIDNRSWARGMQSNLNFAVRPPARNDHTKNPWLNHIDFSSVNEMVKYCDIFVSLLEKNDYDVQATAINPVAAIQKNEIMNDAEAYRQLRPLYEHLDKVAGAKISPNNPINYAFETNEELQIFFQIGFKLRQEIQAELAADVVLNESDWPMLRKMECEDVRDCGFMGVCVGVDLNNRIRANYLDLVNCGWEDYRGHYLAQPSRFWHLTMKTGAQIVAESNFTLTPKELMEMATKSQGRYGNPMITPQTTQMGFLGYVNTDNPNAQNFFMDSWKFPVLETWWEDWDVTKYRSIIRTDSGASLSFIPVDFNYKNDGRPYLDHNDSSGMPVEKRVKVTESHLHYYRQCKWVIGTDVSYDNGPVRFCPRNPYDIRFALCPIKLYRATGAPFSQRLKPIAKIAQNAWFKLQNEIAKARPHAYHIDVRKMNNLTSLDGKKITRQQILELFNQDGTLLWSSAASMDDQGVTTTQQPPIVPLANVDVAAMQRWWDTINQCSHLMEIETGLNQFTNASNPNPETPATSAQAAIAGTDNALAQYVDALSKINEEVAIHAVGTLQQMVRQGNYDGYISSIGGSLLKPSGMVSISDDITDFTYGIKMQAKPTAQQRLELKQTIRQSYASVATPAQGSPYLADLLYLEQLIDGGTNMKLIVLIANHLQQKNLKQMNEMQQANMQAQAQGNQQTAAQASQQRIAEEQQLSNLRMQEDDHKTNNQLKLQSTIQAQKGDHQTQTIAQKAEDKKELLLIEKSISQ